MSMGNCQSCETRWIANHHHQSFTVFHFPEFFFLRNTPPPMEIFVLRCWLKMEMQSHHVMAFSVSMQGYSLNLPAGISDADTHPLWTNRGLPALSPFCRQ